MRFICNDGYYCCDPDCSGIVSAGNPSSSGPCNNCLMIGTYYVHSQDSVPPGCPGVDSNIQINLTRNNYDSCLGAMEFKVVEYDSAYLSDVSIVDNAGQTYILATINKSIPLGEYTEIQYKVMCLEDGTAVFASVYIASKHMCLECNEPNTCDECTGICSEIDLSVQ